jgi:hypothetical protein
MLKVLVTVGMLSFAVWAALDVLQTPVARVQLLPKSVWFAVTLVPLAGALAWLTLGRTVVPTVRRPVRPVAPDDDPDFLRGLGDRFGQPPE